MASIVVDELGALADDVTFDVTRSIVVEHNSVMTDHPVEDGSKITDHVLHEPDTVTLSVFVSNTPVGEIENGQIIPLDVDIPYYEPKLLPTPGSLNQAATNALNRGFDSLMGKANSLQSLQFPIEFDRPKAVYDKLDEWRLAAKRLRVVDRMREYSSLVITALSPQRNVETQGGSDFQVTLRRINLVATETITGVPIPADARGSVKKSLGQQSQKTVPVSGQNTKSSLLLKTLQATGFLDEVPL